MKILNFIEIFLILKFFQIIEILIFFKFWNLSHVARDGRGLWKVSEN
jgi:hypothetical protein